MRKFHNTLLLRGINKCMRTKRKEWMFSCTSPAIGTTNILQDFSYLRPLSFSFWSSAGSNNNHHQQQQQEKDRPAWSEEWKSLGLGAKLVNEPKFPSTLMFVQVGFGVDQHGADDATKASIRAVRNAIEFNSIPGIIEHIPGGRKEMLIHVELGVPATATLTKHEANNNPKHSLMPVDVLHVAKVFPYGKLLPIEIVQGGLVFSTGRVVEELGDTNDKAICVIACISIGYGTPEDNNSTHKTYNTKDGF